MDSPPPLIGNLNALRRLDAACDQFEAAWRNGHRPRIEDYLSLFPPDERPQVLELLQQIQQELILKAWPPHSTPPSTAPADGQSFVSADRNPAPDAGSPPEISRKNATHSSPAPQVQIEVIAGPHAGLKFVFTEHHTLLAGRSVHAQLRLKGDPRVSRHHFRLEMNPPHCFLLDLNSFNGTCVNGERVKERDLKDGDVVSVGRTKLAVQISPSAKPKRKPSPVKQRAANTFRSSPPAPESAKEAAPPTVPQLPMAPLEHPEFPSIPGYEVEARIGTGVLGTVYRAVQLATGTVCAVKVIDLEEHCDKRVVQTFLREASILRQLNHPSLIRLIEAGPCSHGLFLSTEYVPSISWTELTRSWTADKRIRIACGLMGHVLHALDHAHQQGFVHRDVKPENLLFTRTGSRLTVKLADFGLAKQYTNAGLSQMTRHGEVIGSLPYMPPEQFINSRDANPGCDIYSVGATLYWMITGHPPIPLDGHPCPFLAILEEPPVPLQIVCPQAPDKLCDLIHRALDKKPERRFRSAAEMQQQLRHIL